MEQPSPTPSQSKKQKLNSPNRVPEPDAAKETEVTPPPLDLKISSKPASQNT